MKKKRNKENAVTGVMMVKPVAAFFYLGESELTSHTSKVLPT